MSEKPGIELLASAVRGWEHAKEEAKKAAVALEVAARSMKQAEHKASSASQKAAEAEDRVRQLAKFV